MARLRLRNKEFTVSDITRIVHNSLYESLIYLGQPMNDKDRIFCLGVGLVKFIEKGKEFDIVGMDFGKGFCRHIYVKHNHARRQIYTLKRGQLGWFYGFMKIWHDKEGKPNTSYFAKGFQGWYVPKNMDIMRVDTDDFEEMSQENESKLDFIDNLLKGDD